LFNSRAGFPKNPYGFYTTPAMVSTEQSELMEFVELDKQQRQEAIRLLI
jgi:hypothetical protein